MIRSLLQINSRTYAVTVFLCFATLFSGCGKKENETPAAPAVAVSVANQNAKPVQKPVSSTVRLTHASQGNHFDFSSKKDPFKPFVTVKAAPSPEQHNKNISAGLPIHSFDVGQFRLIGVVTGGKENQAMVIDPNGKGYVLKAGMSIGKNDGRITSISASGVDVLEQFKDDNGRVRKEHIRITLPRKQ
jgi:type IV pilus assembly protein PilP